MTRKLHDIQILLFINKVLLVTATLIHLDTVYGYLSNTMTELSSCDRGCMVCKAENIYFLTLYRKSVLALVYMIPLSAKILKTPRPFRAFFHVLKMGVFVTHTIPKIP